MFLSAIFKKYKEKEYKFILIKELIEWLQIDLKQKNLYLESLDFLDDEWLDRFYKKLTSVIEIIEENDTLEKFKKQEVNIQQITTDEIEEKKQEINSFNLILDNI